MTKELDTSFSEKVKQDTNRKGEYKGDDNSLLELIESMNDNRGKEEITGSPSRTNKVFTENQLDIAGISPIVGSSKKGNDEDLDKYFG